MKTEVLGDKIGFLRDEKETWGVEEKSSNFSEIGSLSRPNERILSRDKKVRDREELMGEIRGIWCEESICINTNNLL
jgi:hypothetical protein